MEALQALFRKLTPTRALVLSSGKFETLFFETVYRLTYITGLSTIEQGWGYFIYGSAVKFMLLLLSFGEAAICFDANLSVDERVGCINVCLLQYISIYRYKNKIDNKEAYKELAVSMESPHFDTTTPERRRLVDFWAQKNLDYLKLLVVWGNLTLIAWYIYPLIDDIEYNLSIRIFVPFSYNNHTRYPLVYFAVVVMFGYIAHFVMINDVTMQAHLMHLICRLTVLGDCFKNLLEDCQVGFEGIHPNYLIRNKEFTDKYMRRMGILVEQHSIILRQIMNLRNTLSRAMLFQFMASGTLICFVGFETIMTLTENTAKTVNSLFFLGYNIFELYIICRWCDEITVQSQNIGEAIYACGWENGMSVLPGIKQTVKLVIARANKPLYFTAGGMYSLSLASFSTLVKTSYSTLTVVLRMSHK